MYGSIRYRIKNYVVIIFNVSDPNQYWYLYILTDESFYMTGSRISYFKNSYLYKIWHVSATYFSNLSTCLNFALKKHLKPRLEEPVNVSGKFVRCHNKKNIWSFQTSVSLNVQLVRQCKLMQFLQSLFVLNWNYCVDEYPSLLSVILFSLAQNVSWRLSVSERNEGKLVFRGSGHLNCCSVFRVTDKPLGCRRTVFIGYLFQKYPPPRVNGFWRGQTI